MTRLTRRNFSRLAAVAGLSALAAPALSAGTRPRVVIIGGGAGGASAARALANAGKAAVSITLIEPNAVYHSCFGSNLAIGGLRSFDALRHDYEGLLNRGLNVIEEWVEAIDRDRREVRLSSGVTLGYDRLIVAPGIDIRYDSVPGYSIDAQLAMPHAYKGGAQVEVLTARLKAMRPGGVFVMLAPPEPSRCPPGPYERASMAAQLLASTNPTAKIIVLDPKDEFTKKDLFLDGWKRHYPGMIEWTPLSKLGKVEVDPETMELRAGGQTFKADVANVIPAQKAGQIAEAAGLTENGWCPIVPATMQSRMDENIHVLGDAATASAMPKSAFAANSQAKVAANAILGALTGSPVYEPHYANICWSVIADKDCVKIGGTYQAKSKIFFPASSFKSSLDDSIDVRETNQREALSWYESIVSEMFG